MKQVAHGIDKIDRWLLSLHGFSQSGSLDRNVEPVFISRYAHCFEALCEDTGVAVLTPWRNVRAAGDRIPGSLGPLDLGIRAHAVTRERCSYFVRSVSEETAVSNEPRLALVGPSRRRTPFRSSWQGQFVCREAWAIEDIGQEALQLRVRRYRVLDRP